MIFLSILLSWNRQYLQQEINTHKKNGGLYKKQLLKFNIWTDIHAENQLVTTGQLMQKVDISTMYGKLLH
jgi:hypothetical protein